MKSCFFIGHREVDESLIPHLLMILSRLIEENHVTSFYVGGYGGFDRAAAAAVKKLKEKYPEVLLMLVLPYHPAERPVEVPDGFDGTYYPEGMENTPRRYAIMKANRTMVAQCDWLVCFVRRIGGNSGRILEYARRREARGELHVLNLAEMDLHRPAV